MSPRDEAELRDSGASPTRGPLRLRVTPAAESTLRAGHPWLYAESIREQSRAGVPGELAAVYDRHDKFLAIGLFDPFSPMRLRVLQRGKPQVIDRLWWARRLQEALARRSGLFDQKTTGFRWVNGESDGWPGLVLDRYDQTLVLKLYTAAWLPRLEEIAGIVTEQLKPQRVVLRLSRNLADFARNEFQAQNRLVLCGPALNCPVRFLENGLCFEADVLRGQKTGFFLDQRENRRRVEALAAGRHVLNAFSFSGAFSVYAARGRAKSATDLDLSAPALSAAEKNFELNRSIPAVRSCRHEVVRADAFDWLATPLRRKFDLLVLDPASFAKREPERAPAIRAYGRLVSLALRHLATGGILVACSCSAHVTAEEFFGTVRTAAARSGRRFTELETTGQAPDHPATFREAQYLKAIYLRES